MKQIFFLSLLSIALLCGCSEDPPNIVSPPPPSLDTTFGVLNGVVKDSISDIGIENAELTTIPPTKTVYSDIYGQFTFDSIPTGEYMLMIRKEGYDDVDTSITVSYQYSTTVYVYTDKSNSFWSYYTTLPTNQSGGISVLKNGAIIPSPTPTFVGNNNVFIFGGYILPPNSENWISILPDESPRYAYQNPYNNYVFCETNIIHQVNGGHVIATPDLHVSMDNGLTWQQRLSGLFYSITFAPNNICFATGSVPNVSWDNLYKSVDGGYTWNTIDPIPGFRYENVKQVYYNRIYLFGSYDDTTRYSDDYGKTWTKKPLTNQHANMIRWSILIPNNVLLTTFYLGTSQIGLSYDNGETWTPGGSVPDSSTIFGRKANQNGILYLRKNNQLRGIYASNDYGSTWEFIGTGLPKKKVYGIDIDGDGYVYVVVGNYYVGNNSDIKRVYKSNEPNLRRIDRSRMFSNKPIRENVNVNKRSNR